jgi:DNA-directed RNA polymerase sigma subunit (sigma70/sigma32)
MTLDEVGLYLGMTRERIRQIEGKALTKLSDALTRQGFSAELFLKDVAGN